MMGARKPPRIPDLCQVPTDGPERGFVDDVIDPAETRRKLVAGLELLRSKREELPKRKHGNVPL